MSNKPTTTQDLVADIDAIVSGKTAGDHSPSYAAAQSAPGSNHESPTPSSTTQPQEGAHSTGTGFPQGGGGTSVDGGSSDDIVMRTAVDVTQPVHSGGKTESTTADPGTKCAAVLGNEILGGIQAFQAALLPQEGKVAQITSPSEQPAAAPAVESVPTKVETATEEPEGKEAQMTLDQQMLAKVGAAILSHTNGAKLAAEALENVGDVTIDQVTDALNASARKEAGAADADALLAGQLLIAGQEAGAKIAEDMATASGEEADVKSGTQPKAEPGDNAAESTGAAPAGDPAPSVPNSSSEGKTAAEQLVEDFYKAGQAVADEALAGLGAGEIEPGPPADTEEYSPEELQMALEALTAEQSIEPGQVEEILSMLEAQEGGGEMGGLPPEMGAEGGLPPELAGGGEELPPEAAEAGAVPDGMSAPPEADGKLAGAGPNLAAGAARITQLLPKKA